MRIGLMLICLAATAAHANGGPTDGPKPGLDPSATATAGAAAAAVSGSWSGSASNADAAGGSAVAHGGAGGAASSAVGDTTAEGGSASAVGDVSIRHRDRLQAPGVFTPPALPTAPCVIATSGGLSIPGGGVSLGRGRIDEECTLRETARMFESFGETEFALELLCTSAAVAASGLQARCPTRARQVVTLTVPPDCSAADERLRRCESVTGK